MRFGLYTDALKLVVNQYGFSTIEDEDISNGISYKPLDL